MKHQMSFRAKSEIFRENTAIKVRGKTHCTESVKLDEIIYQFIIATGFNSYTPN